MFSQSIECHPYISKLYTLTWYYQYKYIPKFKHTGPGFLKTSAIAIKKLIHRFLQQSKNFNSEKKYIYLQTGI